MNYVRDLMGILGLMLDVAGVLIVFTGAVMAIIHFLARPLGSGDESSYRQLRTELARAILLGLEFLVAGDIIRTVAVSPTLDRVLVLGVIVLVRTFLSLSMNLEVEGRWPWQRAGQAAVRRAS